LSLTLEAISKVEAKSSISVIAGELAESAPNHRHPDKTFMGRDAM
jgi:hypothetical protein